MRRSQSSGSSGPHKSSSSATPQQQRRQQPSSSNQPQPQTQQQQPQQPKKAQPCKNATSTANTVWSQVVSKMNCNSQTSQMNNVVGMNSPPTMMRKQQQQQGGGRRSKGEFCCYCMNLQGRDPCLYYSGIDGATSCIVSQCAVSL